MVRDKVEHLAIAPAWHPYSVVANAMIEQAFGHADVIRLIDPVAAILETELPEHEFLTKLIEVSGKLHAPDIIDLYYPRLECSPEVADKAKTVLTELSQRKVELHPMLPLPVAQPAAKRRKIKRAVVSCIDFRFFHPVSQFVRKELNGKVHHFSWAGVMLGFVSPFGELVLNQIKQTKAEILHLIFHDDCGGHGFCQDPKPPVHQRMYYRDLAPTIAEHIRTILGGIKIHFSFSRREEVIHLMTFERDSLVPMYAF